MSKTRKQYFIRLILRIIIFITCIILYILKPNTFDILFGWNFFKSFSILHILWVIWVFDMLAQIIPIKHQLPLGSHKLFKYKFKPSKLPISIDKIKKYIINTTKGAIKVLILWIALISVIATLYFCNVIDAKIVFLISVFFYVCDLICVLIWCPFRLIMKNKCCTTCRIFNWDHIMMFSPLIFIGGFYGISLFVLAALAVLIWEVSIMIYPERFTEIANVSLKCSECTDKLCTQYCQKIKKIEIKKSVE